MIGGSRLAVLSNSPGYINLGNVAISSDDASEQNVTAVFYLDSDGGARKRPEDGGSGATEDITGWHSKHPSTAIGDAYEVRIAHTGGDNDYDRGDVLGSWLGLDSNRSWTFEFNQEDPDVRTGTFSIEIGLDGTSTAIVTKTLTITLEVNSP